MAESHALNGTSTSAPPTSGDEPELEPEPAPARYRHLQLRTGAKPEDLPRTGTWTFFIGPPDSWMAIGATHNLPAELASRQRAWPTTLVVSCLIEGAHADDLAGEFAQQKRPGGTFAVKGALQKFLAEHRLSQPVALRNLSQPIALRNLTRYPMHPNSPEAATSDELHNGMPMWELYRYLND